MKDLEIFLTGYCFGLDSVLPSQEFPHGKELREFHLWLLSRFNDGRAMNLDDLLIRESSGDDAAAFDAFFALWDEFVRLAPRAG